MTGFCAVCEPVEAVRARSGALPARPGAAGRAAAGRRRRPRPGAALPARRRRVAPPRPRRRRRRRRRSHTVGRPFGFGNQSFLSREHVDFGLISEQVLVSFSNETLQRFGGNRVSIETRLCFILVCLGFTGFYLVLMGFNGLL